MRRGDSARNVTNYQLYSSPSIHNSGAKMEGKMMGNKFNFYEFNDAPYYALVVATNTYEALKTYDTAVSDIEPEQDFLPDEVSEEEDLTKLSKSPADEDKPGQMGMEKAQELIEEYKDLINAALDSQRDFESHIGELVLIDASLL